MQQTTKSLCYSLKEIYSLTSTEIHHPLYIYCALHPNPSQSPSPRGTSVSFNQVSPFINCAIVNTFASFETAITRYLGHLTWPQSWSWSPILTLTVVQWSTLHDCYPLGCMWSSRIDHMYQIKGVTERSRKPDLLNKILIFDQKKSQHFYHLLRWKKDCHPKRIFFAFAKRKRPIGNEDPKLDGLRRVTMIAPFIEWPLSTKNATWLQVYLRTINLSPMIEVLAQPSLLCRPLCQTKG